jgi:transposase
MTKTRRKIDAALKAKIALEASREQAAVAERAQRHQVQEHAARAFDPKIGQNAEAAASREIEKLHSGSVQHAVLRFSIEPMTPRDVALDMVVKRALDPRDVKLFRHMVCRIAGSLRGQRDQGIVRSEQGPGHLQV